MSHRPIRRLCLPLLLLLLSYSLPLGAVRRTIHLSSYGLRAGAKESCTPLMRKILGDLRRELQSEGDTLELLFAPGTTSPVREQPSVCTTSPTTTTPVAVR